ncbi:MAG: translesion error-prone DNA polymerase V autoproteolytic subunit [Kovacikia sp.]
MIDDPSSLIAFRPDLSSEYWLPLFSNAASCGFPSPADSHVEETLNLNDLLIKRPAATFFVRVSGDSMLLAGIHSGDLLVVDRSLEATDGRVVVAVINGELFVKRLRIKQGKTLLMADNPDYAPIEITEAMTLHIWGVVTNVIHSL